MRLDSISEGIETQSTTSSVHAHEAGSNSSTVGDVDGGPEETPSSETSGLVLAAVAQQLREHSHVALMARQEAREAAENMDLDMAQQKSDARETHQEMVEALAMARSKADRLQGKLESTNSVIERYASEAKDHQSKMQSNNSARLEAEMKLEELMEAGNEHQTPQQEDQHEQLLAAVQSSKLACGRAEDFRQEIESLKARHALEVETLERELSIVRISQANAGDQSCSSASMLLDLQEQVSHLTEERNELQNTLECQEIQWRTKVEDLEMQLAVQRSAAAAA